MFLVKRIIGIMCAKKYLKYV